MLVIHVSSVCVLVLFFFFKQKTAYEMLRSLVGSEMCIRDRVAVERGDDDLADFAGWQRLARPRLHDFENAAFLLSLIHI